MVPVRKEMDKRVPVGDKGEPVAADIQDNLRRTVDTAFEPAGHRADTEERLRIAGLDSKPEVPVDRADHMEKLLHTVELRHIAVPHRKRAAERHR